MTDIQIESMSIDQLAGSFVLIMGAIGSLLLVVWQSRCECDLNLCYIIRCHRKPPPDEVLKKGKDKGKGKGKDKDKDKDNIDVVIDELEDEEIIPLSAEKDLKSPV